MHGTVVVFLGRRTSSQVIHRPQVIMEKINNLLEKFGRDLNKYPVLAEVEKKTNVPKQYLVLGVGCVLLGCLLMGFGASLIW